MTPVIEREQVSTMSYALAGLHAGILGGMFLLLWVAISWLPRSVWSMPNLMATTFFGDGAYRSGLLRTTWSGLALHFFLSGVLGVAFGLVVRDRGGRKGVLLAGLVYAVAIYYLAYYVVWHRFNPLIPLYAPARPMLLGHVIYGAVLGRYATYRNATI